MHIVQIGSEVAPVAKVGGLGDVVLGLSRQLKREGHEVNIILPRYDCLKGLEAPTLYKKEQRSFFQGKWHTNSIYKAPLEKELTLTLLEPHHSRLFFSRGSIYGSPDDSDRFLYFCRAVLDFLSEESTTPDIIHIHDWMCAPIAFLIRSGTFLKRFKNTRVLLTIHNMEYQGWTDPRLLHEVGYTEPLEPLKLPFSDEVNLLKAGIVFADAVNTVSPTYAKEVLQEENGKGLQDVIKQIGDKFSGVLNGVDYTSWNPENDPLLTHNYSKEDLSGKQKIKRELQKKLGLDASSSRPLLATVCRLVEQKGVHLIEDVIQRADELGIQCVILGSTQDPEMQEKFMHLVNQTAKSHHVRILLKSDETLAHTIFAASDLFFVPSIFEPCGLTQMIAMRYGSVPVVRKTGGLADTVVDIEYNGTPFEEANGFSFDFPDSQGVDYAVKRAVRLYTRDHAKWTQLMKQGMIKDFSWQEGARHYLALYNKILL